jgi:ATP-dependent helicase/nuclease subunit A
MSKKVSATDMNETITERIVSGKTDMVFKEGDGWVIVDYKSDTIDGNLEELVDYHSLQVNMYREFRARITGRQ